ncbi:hypothetical protein BN946_scf184962.g61 [Trametes cinnabarina]|uniref:BTB domain-containing protein n=1 Tax=Pycnoporus cinnabarinus TaxID=5643 RepID=A0A060SI52_PYCCI|nr:hypothetical protein BN946_scf184962.g61 [Trametes cinnabarina]
MPLPPFSPGTPDSISSVFHPGFVVDGLLPDLTITTPEWIHFNVHSELLLSASTNAFGGLLSQPNYLLAVPETAVVINILLNVIYGIPCHHNPPPLPSTQAALEAIIKYGIPLAPLTVPNQPLYQLILSYAPYYPIEAYALAAHYHLEALAVAISSHLLSYDVSRITDDLVIKMGPMYFSRLVRLQRSRLAALRDIVSRPPATHPDTPTCDHRAQRELSRAWAFATAELVWEALPNTSTHALRTRFAKAGASIACLQCQTSLYDRIQEVTEEWLAVKSSGLRPQAPTQAPLVRMIPPRPALRSDKAQVHMTRFLFENSCIHLPAFVISFLTDRSAAPVYG